MRRVKLTVKRDLCKGCGICIKFCPAQILEASAPTLWGGQSPGLVKGGETQCMLARGSQGISCRLCEKRCPDAAITIEVKEK